MKNYELIENGRKDPFKIKVTETAVYFWGTHEDGSHSWVWISHDIKRTNKGWSVTTSEVNGTLQNYFFPASRFEVKPID